jgi:hypothetical protein
MNMAYAALDADAGCTRCTDAAAPEVVGPEQRQPVVVRSGGPPSSGSIWRRPGLCHREGRILGCWWSARTAAKPIAIDRGRLLRLRLRDAPVRTVHVNLGDAMKDESDLQTEVARISGTPGQDFRKRERIPLVRATSGVHLGSWQGRTLATR